MRRQDAAEQLMIDRMRGAAAQRAGDNATAIQAFEAVYATRQAVGARAGADRRVAGLRLFAAEGQRQGHRVGQQGAAGRRQQRAAEPAAGLPARRRAATTRRSPRTRRPPVRPPKQAGRTPDEGDLLRLADAPAAHRTTRRLRAPRSKSWCCYYPKKDYWNAYLGRLPRKPGFADRFALDVMRLKLATGTLTKTDDFMEMAQLALQAGCPAEGQGASSTRASRPARWAPAPRPRATSACATWRSSRRPRARASIAGQDAPRRRGQGRQRPGQGGLRLRHDGPGRQGHRADRARHRQGRPEAPRRRQAAPGHGAAAVGQDQGQGACRRCAACEATTARRDRALWPPVGGDRAAEQS